MIIAIDGRRRRARARWPSASQSISAFAHLDTGLLYRAVARDMGKAGLDYEDPQASAAVALALDTDEPGRSRAAQPRGWRCRLAGGEAPPVRAALLVLQRRFARRSRAPCSTGGTSARSCAPMRRLRFTSPRRPRCAPNRRFKGACFARRWNDLRRCAGGYPAPDERDAGRDAAPMRPADDAVLLDTSNLDIEAAFDKALGVISQKVGQLR